MNDIVGKKVRITFCGVCELKGMVLKVSDGWITFRYGNKSRVKMFNTRFISSIEAIE